MTAGTKHVFLIFAVFISLNLFAQPTISSFSPTSGTVGTTVTITGTNFSTTPANNIVYFGAVRANVTAATSTSISVTVPAGATYHPITVTVNNLTAYSLQPFSVTFAGGGDINTNSLANKIDFTTDLHPNDIVIADLDGDGKPDVATANNYSTAGQPASFTVLRNTSSGGNITFAPKQDFNNGVQTYSIAVGDIDGDGKPDIIVNSIADQNISIFRNTSSPGTLGFAPKIDYPSPSGTRAIVVGDIDIDGKPDIIIVNMLANTFSVYRNISSTGNISFAARVDFATSLGPEYIAIGDFDGDNKQDIAVSNSLTNSFSIFRNTSTNGNVSFAPRVDINNASGNDPKGIVVADWNGDNKLDISVVIYNNSSGNCAVQFFRNTSSIGNISFAFATSGSGLSGNGYHIAAGDINGDGKPDLALSMTDQDKTRIFQNFSTTGTFNFVSAGDFSSPFPYAVALADFDMDSKPDMITSFFVSDLVSVFKNQCGLPGIISFSPNAGNSGTVVTISGTNFTGTTAVSFGGIPASSFTIINSTTISAVVGTGASGNVTVTTSLGSANMPGFQFLGPPVVTSFSPTSGFSGTLVTIYGQNFNVATSVSFGGVAASSFNIIDPSTINAVVGTGASGNVSVTTPFGTGSLAGFNYVPLPMISSFNPTSAGTGGTVTISGQNFTGATAVNFGGTPAASFNVVSATTITAIVGSGSSGSISVTTAFGIGSLSGFTYIPSPIITSFSPTSAGGGVTVTINGSNFLGVSAVRFGGILATSFNVVSATTITAVVSGGGASGAITVTNPSGTGSLPGFIFVPQPLLTDFTPRITGAGGIVTITGTNLSTATAVSFGGTPASSFNVVNAATITAVVGSGTNGNVSVTTIGGFSSIPGFNFTTIPIISSFSPKSGPVGSTVTIMGANFDPITTNNIVYFGAVKTIVTASTANTLTVTVPFGASYQPITVTTNNRTAYSALPFAVTFSGGGSFTSNSFAGRVDFLSEGNPESIAVGDIDGDGKPDIVVTNPTLNTISIFRNTSTLNTLSFAPKIDIAAGLNPHAINLADLDGDGKLDILLLNSADSSGIYIFTISIFKNLSNPGNILLNSRMFFNTSNIYNPYDLAIADLNLDGKPDIVVTHFATSLNNNPLLTVYRNESTVGNIIITPLGYFQLTGGTIYTPLSSFVSIADLNNDQMPDIIVGTTSTGTNYTYIIKSTFVAGPGISLSNVLTIFCNCITNYSATADFDGDNRSDIITTNGIHRNTTENIYAFTFSGQTIAGIGGILSIGNLSGNDKPDFARLNPTTNTVSAVKNSSTVGSISFEPNENYNTGTNPKDVSIADLNGDGKPDIVTANKDFNTISVLLNNIGYSGLSISSFTPTTGNAGTVVTITGSNFGNVSGVSFGGVAASSFSVVSSTEITAIVGTGSSGNVSVTTTSGTVSLGWFYFTPILISFSPTSGGIREVITITGTDLIGASAVSFGGVPAFSFTVISPTTIIAEVGISGASGNVSISTPGGTLSLPGFTFIPAPTISSFTPTSAVAGTTVTITGTNFNGTTSVLFGGIASSSFTVVNSTTITAIVGNGASGGVRVTTPGGSAFLAGFTFIPAPVISSFTPTTAGTGATITITGTNFTGTTAVSFGGVAASSFTVVNSTTITAVVGSGASGNVSVTAPGGTASLAGFTFNPVTAINPVPFNPPPELSITPNPATKNIIVRHPSSIREAYIQCIDMLGRIVKTISVARTITQTDVNVEELSSGIYKIIWSDGIRSASGTFMVR